MSEMCSQLPRRYHARRGTLLDQIVSPDPSITVALGLEFAMVDDRTIRRTKMRERFSELKRSAIADLERRGYDVRGKTPAQIRLILKRRPSKQTSDAKGALKEPPRSGHGASDVIT